MIKKLEPVLKMKKRSHATLPTASSLHGPQDDITAEVTTIKTRDEFCFPSSPGERAEEKTTKEGTKNETEVSKKHLAKAKKILKVSNIL